MALFTYNIQQVQNENGYSAYMDTSVVQLLGALKRLGKFLRSEEISKIEIPTVSRGDFLSCVLGNDNLSNLKSGIIGESKSIKKDTKVLKIYEAFFKETENVAYVEAVKGQPWAEKDAPDYGFHLLFGIQYLRKKHQDIKAFDIVHKSALEITPGSLQSEAVRILENIRSIDALYKLFTCVFKDPKLKDAVSLLQQLILQRAAAVLEPISKRSSVGGKDCVAIWHLLEAFLHEVFITRQGVPGHSYQYKWSYAQLFCHCIRHDCLTFSGENVEIINHIGRESSICTLNAKFYVKITISLVNIVGMVLSDEGNFSLPIQLSNLLMLPVSKVSLAPEVLSQLKSEMDEFTEA